MTISVAPGITLAVGDALTTPFSLSVLTATRGNASKRIIVGAHGQPVKNADDLAISAGMLEHVQVAGLAGLQALLRTIQPTQALVHGILRDSQPRHTAPLVTKDKLARATPGTLAPGTIARSLDFLVYPSDVHVLMWDRDDNPEDPTIISTPDQLLAVLAPLVPGITPAGALVTNSTSSAIKDKKTGAWLLPPTGYHIYQLVRGNLARFVEILRVRLWNAGYGFCKLASPNAQTGVAAVLERAVVDLSVFSPERLDYVAGARIAKNAPFYQERGEPRLIPGTILHLDAVPDVTPEERQEYQDRLAAAKADLAPERFQKVKAAITAADPALSPDAVEALAQQRLAQQEEGSLPQDYLLSFYHRKKAVCVADLSADYDGLRLADPAEPTYRDGTDAIFHWRQGDWLINSFAHGMMRTYRAVPVPPPDPDEEDFQNLVQQAEHLAERSQNGHGSCRSDTRPEIIIGPKIADVADAAEDALVHMPGAPLVYQRARRLAVIAYGGDPPTWLRRPPDLPVIVDASAAHLRELMSEAARWQKLDKRTKKYEPALPPAWAVDTTLGRTRWPFPVLEGIVCSPTLRPDGSILATPGYDPSTGLYLDFNGTHFPPVPDKPDTDQARRALARLRRIFRDVCFAGRTTRTDTNPSLSAALAAVLTLVGRGAIQGNVPFFGVTATASGSGKGMTVDTICLIGTGRCAPKMGQTLDEEEEGKRLLALALEGASVCCIDNVTHPLGNQYLELALTSRMIRSRLLGQNTTIEAPWQAVMFATGNNLTYKGDMGRRVLPIALDPQMENPETRTDLTHPDLLAWVQRVRPHLVTAALTILRAYCVKTCPSQGLTPWGSFEAWSDLIRSALVWLGEADPCAGRQAVVATNMPEHDTLADLLGAWQECFATEVVTLAKATEAAVRNMVHVGPESAIKSNKWNDLHAALGGCDARFDGKTLRTKSIGMAMAKWNGTVIGNKRLRNLGRGGGNKTEWQLEIVAPPF